MGISRTAQFGVAAAVRYNPTLALQLLGILRTTPRCVKHKPGDVYGPLGFIFAGFPPQQSAPGAAMPILQEPLDAEASAACKTFNKEWLSGTCTKSDLADAIEASLADLGAEIPAHWPKDVTIYRRRP